VEDAIRSRDQPLPVRGRAVPDGTINSCLTNLSK